MDTTAADLSNRAVFHKSRQTPNTAQTVLAGNFFVFPQQIVHRAKCGETGRLLLVVSFFSVIAFNSTAQTWHLNIFQNRISFTNRDKCSKRREQFCRVLSRLSLTNRTQGEIRRNRVVFSMFTLKDRNILHLRHQCHRHNRYHRHLNIQHRRCQNHIRLTAGHSVLRQPAHSPDFRVKSGNQAY